MKNQQLLLLQKHLQLQQLPLLPQPQEKKKKKMINQKETVSI
jgi:hypothetical protein